MHQEVLKPFSMEALALVPGSLYEHYSGKQYRLLGVGRHSETLEEVAIYEAQYGEREIWVRPLKMFLEEIVINGTRRPRFAKQ